MMKDVPIVGWDVAFTTKGVVLLEVGTIIVLFVGLPIYVLCCKVSVFVFIYMIVCLCVCVCARAFTDIYLRSPLSSHVL